MKATVDVGAVMSRLWPVPDDALKVLRERYTIEVKGARFARRAKPWWDGTQKFFGADGRFLTGLLPAVVDVVESFGHRVSYADNRERPKLLPGWRAARALRDYQEEIARDMVAVTRCVVRAATNSGKTDIAISVAAQVSARTIFLTPTADLALQTRDRFAAGIAGPRVGLLSGRGDVLVADTTDGADVVVANVQGLSAKTRSRVELPGRGPRGGKRWKLGPFTPEGREFLRSFGVLFADEIHLLTSHEWSKLSRECTAYYRFAMSATPTVGDPARDTLLTGLFGETVGEVKQQFLADRGISARITVTMIPYERRGLIQSRSFDDQKLEGIVLSGSRNDAIAAKIVEEARAGMRCMVLVERKQHAEELGRRVGLDGFEWLFMHGGNRDERPGDWADFKSGRVRVAMMTRIGNVGLDNKEVDRLFVASGGRDWNATVQRAGRLVRSRDDKKWARLYDCRDVGIYDKAAVPAKKRFLEKHYEERVAAYRSEGFEIEGE